jgi:hypothetical protein
MQQLLPLFRSDPIRLSLDEIELNTKQMNIFAEKDRLIRNIRQNLGHEVGFVSFADSGPDSDSEYLYLRTIQSSKRYELFWMTGIGRPGRPEYDRTYHYQ